MVTNTVTYGLQVPSVGGDGNAWGGYLNNDLNKLDVILNVLQTNNIGSSAPTLPPAVPGSPNNLLGSFWIDNTAAAAWKVQIYDGSQWVSIGTLDSVNHTFITPGSLLNVQSLTTPGVGTYTPTAGATTAIVICVGAGGGGAGSFVVTGSLTNNGNPGGTSSFGSPIVCQATGGNGGGGSTATFNGIGGSGGVGSSGLINMTGNAGQTNPTLFLPFGGGGSTGGGSYFGGGGQAIPGTTGGAGTNGGGGAGASGNNTNCTCGGGGGAGGCSIAFIQSGLASTTYTIGTGGTGGAAYGGGFVGGAGGNGIIIVYEYA